MEILLIFVGSFIVGLSGAIVPGPLFTVTISETTQRGIWAAPLLICGHALCEVAMIFGLVLGIGPLLQSGSMFRIISVIGGGILLWMSYGLFSSSLELELKGSVHSRRTNPVWLGALLSITNPHWIVWWATLGVKGIMEALTVGGILAVVAFGLGHILSDYLWYGFVGVALSLGKDRLTPGLLRGIQLFCGFALVVLGGYFIIEGLFI
ncbi:MAG: LysE family translocator [Limnochordia bacterium]|jgi:threonine/homoserine/homoserine lactone efflux protein